MKVVVIVVLSLMILALLVVALALVVASWLLGEPLMHLVRKVHGEESDDTSRSREARSED